MCVSIHPVDRAIGEVVRDFQLTPQRYFTEEDVRWRLMNRIEALLVEQGCQDVQLQAGVAATLHGEYPTPFRCSMADRGFALKPAVSRYHRGHFDVVLLDPAAAASCDFELVRSQYYRVLLDALSRRSLPLPFLDCVIELKLYRD